MELQKLLNKLGPCKCGCKDLRMGTVFGYFSIHCEGCGLKVENDECRSGSEAYHLDKWAVEAWNKVVGFCSKVPTELVQAATARKGTLSLPVSLTVPQDTGNVKEELGPEEDRRDVLT